MSTAKKKTKAKGEKKGKKKKEKEEPVNDEFDAMTDLDWKMKQKRWPPSWPRQDETAIII